MDSKLTISFLEQSNPSKSLPKSTTTEQTDVNEDTETSTESLTPDQRKTLEYMNMAQTLVLNAKEIKRFFYSQAASS